MKLLQFYPDRDPQGKIIPQFILEMQVWKGISERILKFDDYAEWVKEETKGEKEECPWWYLSRGKYLFDEDLAIELAQKFQVEQCYIELTFLNKLIVKKAKEKLEHPTKLVSELLNSIK